jgi:hypothetical protein
MWDSVITLYVASGTPSSIIAVSNLHAALDGLGLEQRVVEIVDVFTEPAAALRVGLIATPALVAVRNGRKQWFIGDLRQQDRVQGWIASVAATQSPKA